MFKNIKKRVAENMIISFSGKVLSSLLGIVSIAFMARELGSDGFGNYTIVVAFLYVFSVFADFGLYSYLTREISKPNSDEKKIVSDVFVSRIFLVIFFFALSIIVVYLMPFYSSEIKFATTVTTLGFIFLSLSQVFMGVFQKYLKTIIPTLADLLTRLIQFLLVLYLYFTGADFFDFLLVFVLASFINFLFIYIYVRKIIPFKLRSDKKSVIFVLKRSWPLAISSILVLAYFKGDVIILSFLKDASDVGVYNIAYKIIENVIFFPAMFVGLIMPLLSRYFIENIESFKKVFQKSFDFLNIISIPIVFGGFYLSEKIMTLIGGGGFYGSDIAFKILIFSVFFIFLGALFGNAIIAINKQKEVMYAYGIVAVFNILANIYFIKKYSYVGASIINVFTELFITLLMFFIIFKAIKFIPNIKIIFKAVLASIFMVFVLNFVPFENIFILLFFGVLSYFVFMYLIKGISKEDFKLFLKR